MPTESIDLAFVALLPAAGIGTRMGSEVPKQYLDCLGQPLIYHSLALFQNLTWIDEIVVTLADDDHWWSRLCEGKFSKCRTTPGGLSRAESVRNGLQAIARNSDNRETWVLVHDAARPCLAVSDVEKLRSAVLAQEQRSNYGVILADKIHDTVKKVNRDGRIVRTEDRQFLWRALTPQVFELHSLLNALDSAVLETITDEASVMEQQGVQPEVIQGDSTNIKVTTMTDLDRATLYLSQAEK